MPYIIKNVISLEKKWQAVITEKHGAHGCNFGEDGGFAPNISRQDTSTNFFWFVYMDLWN